MSIIAPMAPRTRIGTSTPTIILVLGVDFEEEVEGGEDSNPGVELVVVPMVLDGEVLEGLEGLEVLVDEGLEEVIDEVNIAVVESNISNVMPLSVAQYHEP